MSTFDVFPCRKCPIKKIKKKQGMEYVTNTMQLFKKEK